ncbi:uncharacterized protein LOC130791172 [Actinidia eriantha]|uniref:uncharacterized protein LOC130791172 n=1 Tax=Actinidia eriantha TaxID=165200 RepID=UPI00258A31AA|nr:uncharacterized protein LOC130791172 [Actinidia eriantha]
MDLKTDPSLEMEGSDADDEVFYAELRRQVLLLTTEDDDDDVNGDFPKKKLPNYFQGSGSGFSGSTLHGICFGWFETEEVNAVPAWLVNLWRNGNGNGTGVFIPRIVKPKRRRKPRGRNSERRRNYKSGANKQE